MARRAALAPGLLALLFAGRLAAQQAAPSEQPRVSEPPLPPDPAAHPYEPPPPPLKPFASRSHALLGFHLGFPGSLNRDGADQDLASTLGFNLRTDEPLAQYVLLGPLLQFGSWRPAQPSAFGHSYFVDLDLLLRFRVPIATAKFNYQVWLGMPVGVSGDIPSKDFGPASFGIGWNIGVLFGGAIHFAPKFGLFGEVGWEQHRMTHARDDQSDLDLELQQALLNVGIVVRN
ncbi:MAG TPA: hypothetical protein VNG33_17010 [Polyangiaceae bacterium]|nr:hypothetical protein [Polyangiaceae bacterium]